MFNRLPLVLGMAAISACATQQPIAFSPSDTCSVTATNYESREVQCRFPKSETGHKFRLKANFTGGHDDTIARLDPFMNDAPLACDDGSKTYLSSEDGDVSLWCTFSPAGTTDSDHIFKVSIRFSHAQYVNYEIAAQ